VREYVKTVLMVTHDPVVAKLADLELHLEKGLLVEGHQVQQNAYAGGAA
jgi:ABC-type lipoprotein export system ATPase subunit